MTIQQAEKIIQISAALAAIVSGLIMLSQALGASAMSQLPTIEPCLQSPP